MPASCAYSDAVGLVTKLALKTSHIINLNNVNSASRCSSAAFSTFLHRWDISCSSQDKGGVLLPLNTWINPCSYISKIQNIIWSFFNHYRLSTTPHLPPFSLRLETKRTPATRKQHLQYDYHYTSIRNDGRTAPSVVG